MRDLLTGRLRVLEQSPDGRLFDAQPASSIAVAAQQLGQDAQPLVEPGAFFVDGSYSLRINSWNSLTGVAVTVRMRFLNSRGRIVDSEFVHTPNTNRTKATSDFPLGVGFPLNLTAFASAAAPLVGQTFVQVQLISGLGGATTLLGTLLQDYVTSVQALAWPGSPIRSSIDGGGVVRIIQGTTPAAGAEIAEVVPTGARWRLLTVRYLLTTAVAVANRRSFLLMFAPGPIVIAQLESSGVQAASLGFSYNWGANLPSVYDTPNGTLQQSFIYNTRLLAGQTLATSTALIQAADQYSLVVYTVEEYLEAAA